MKKHREKKTYHDHKWWWTNEGEIKAFKLIPLKSENKDDSKREYWNRYAVELLCSPLCVVIFPKESMHFCTQKLHKVQKQQQQQQQEEEEEQQHQLIIIIEMNWEWKTMIVWAWSKNSTQCHINNKNIYNKKTICTKRFNRLLDRFFVLIFVTISCLFLFMNPSLLFVFGFMLAFVQVYPLQPNAKQNCYCTCTQCNRSSSQRETVLPTHTHTHRWDKSETLANAKSFLRSDRQSCAMQCNRFPYWRYNVHKVKKPSYSLHRFPSTPFTLIPLDVSSARIDSVTMQQQNRKLSGFYYINQFIEWFIYKQKQWIMINFDALIAH